MMKSSKETTSATPRRWVLFTCVILAFLSTRRPLHQSCLEIIDETQIFGYEAPSLPYNKQELSKETSFDSSKNNAKESRSDAFGSSIDHCSIDYWLSEIDQYETRDDLILRRIKPSDVTFVYTTFTVGNSFTGSADDYNRTGKRRTRSFERDTELELSKKCLNATFPTIPVQEIVFGDFNGYKEAMIQTHLHLASDWDNSKASFILDADVFASRRSNVTTKTLISALDNVDLALSLNPIRRPLSKNFNPQMDGFMGGIIFQRHNVRTRLFNECVAQVMVNSGTKSMRQQAALNKVLIASPVASLLRIGTLPPEFHCWSADLTNVNDYAVKDAPGYDARACYFLHSHRMGHPENLGNLCDDEDEVSTIESTK